MLSLMHAGLVAAVRQLGAAISITLSAYFLSSHVFVVQKAPATGSGAEAVANYVSLLTWAYLLVALGLALSSCRSVNLTAACMRRAANFVRFVSARHALEALVLQLSLSAIMFAAMALRTPQFIIQIDQYFGSEFVAAIGWAGAMSTGVACFGASAHAALKAIG